MSTSLFPDANLDTNEIKKWRSIVTLIVFVFTNLVVLFPFDVPYYVPRQVRNATLDTLSKLRIISPRLSTSGSGLEGEDDDHQNGKNKPFIRLSFPMNFVTAPLIADLFLLAIGAIGRKEVSDGTIGADHISPLDIMIFFITLAYIAISIDASGLIRWLAFKVLQKAGKVGHRLFFYLYTFFFALGSFIGNDPIILSGTAFLAYMTRVSSNIIHPRAWIHTQFAIANIASAILVSSNPTNLVLAGAFNVKFIHYTANMIVPVVVTAILLFPFLLYIVFADENLIPYAIKMHELSEEAKARKPVNPNIPNARGTAEEEEQRLANNEEGMLLSLEEIMNPYLDWKGAAFGAIIMTVTLITLLALNASTSATGEHPVFWVTLPAAVVMFCWDVAFGWFHRQETRQIAQKGRQEVELARAERLALQEEEHNHKPSHELTALPEAHLNDPLATTDDDVESSHQLGGETVDTRSTQKPTFGLMADESQPASSQQSPGAFSTLNEKQECPQEGGVSEPRSDTLEDEKGHISSRHLSQEATLQRQHGPTTLVSLVGDTYRWSQETFPTVTAVMAHLPFALPPFAFCMFVQVQGLVTKGWVPVFAYGWDHWVQKTGTVGAIGGMAFLSVILCNFAGTNIGTTILLSRVIQAWEEIHRRNGIPISDRTFWATVYAMAIGVNYGAFSTAFSASLAGMLWRDILERKHIRVRRLEFARVNLPIIAISMAVGCAVLVGQVYIVRTNDPYCSREGC